MTEQQPPMPPSGPPSPPPPSYQQPPQQYQQPPYQPPAPPQAPPPPKKSGGKGKWILLGAGILVVLIIIIAAVAGTQQKSEKKKESTKKTETETSKPQQTSPGTTTGAATGTKDNPYQVGQEVVAGDSVWQVSNVQKATTLQTPIGTETPSGNGVFATMTITVRNTSTKEQNVEAIGIESKIYDSQGRDCEQSDKRIGMDNALVFEQIPPGITLTKTAVFEVAQDATGLLLRVHGWGYSDAEAKYINLGI